MRQRIGVSVIALLVCLLLSQDVLAQQSKAGMLNAADLKQAVPTNYFFAGRTAPVQLRNATGFRVASGKMVLAALVDTSGYATDIAEKFQGLLITEVKLHMGEADVAPGAYGFGYGKDGTFRLMNVAGDDLLTTAAQTDEGLAHPVPLKFIAVRGVFRLYAGKKWVLLKTE